MVITMTNRLLAVVIAIALSSGIAAHAAQDPQRPLAPIAVPAATDLPTVLQTAASHLTETATGAIDPAGTIRAAYQRDHVALERLRQQASALKGSAHPAFNQYVNDQEAALTEIEHTALATARPEASSTIAAMDQLVNAAGAHLNQLLQTNAKANNGNGQDNGSANGEGKSNNAGSANGVRNGN